MFCNERLVIEAAMPPGSVPLNSQTLELHSAQSGFADLLILVLMLCYAMLGRIDMRSLCTDRLLIESCNSVRKH